MVIDKILNNNVVITKNLLGIETVIMGRGIAFGHSAGDEVDESKIEKTFAITNSEYSNKIYNLLSSIPVQYMIISQKIIDKANIMLGKQIGNNIYLTLTENIYEAIKRYKNNIVLENPFKWDIKMFYTNEYQVGVMAKQIIFEHTQIKLSDDEIAFIAMNFINIEQENSKNKTDSIIKIMHDICKIVCDYFNITLDEDSLEFYRFITHLKFFAQRILSNKHYDDNMNMVLKVVSEENPKAYHCSKKIQEYLNENYNFKMTSDEVLCLCMHIVRLSHK